MGLRLIKSGCFYFTDTFLKLKTIFLTLFKNVKTMNMYDVYWLVRTKFKTYSGIKNQTAPTEEKATELVRMEVWLNEFQDMPISSVLIANCIKTKQFYHL